MRASERFGGVKIENMTWEGDRLFGDSPPDQPDPPRLSETGEVPDWGPLIGAAVVFLTAFAVTAWAWRRR